VQFTVTSEDGGLFMQAAVAANRAVEMDEGNSIARTPPL